VLLKYFQRVLRIFANMEVGYQKVIADITRRMGVGMADYATKKTSIDTVANYDLYCHYVAGLVGHGLSALFAASGLEKPQLANEPVLSNNMGLFLQKTNIIRDYLEDLQEGRTWWPEEVWRQYGGDLGDFAKNPRAPQSLACLNHMVTDALSLVPDSLRYLSLLQDRKIFEFCAIPQVMALATLELCYANSNILSRTGVKIRKGLSCKLMLHSSTLRQVHGWFYAFAQRIEKRVNSEDPSAKRTLALVAEIKNLTRGEVDRLPLGPRRMTPRRLAVATVLAWGALLTGGVYAVSRGGAMQSKGASQLQQLSSRLSLPEGVQKVFTRGAMDAVVTGAASVGAAFLGGFLGMQFV
jgi:farnesyl-diphosphate farnesyltransferase